ncbi:Phosphatidylinositol transfer protein [Sparassis crispa]|uniref:Phosphatidylinositol transfer protein SFH5 n=1 Tax=Sparassis crispa TaxID=139825 RepID=A0A401GND7_9APHY|nr:Phosphatidylinositol transfer protein [Sparassis crispa]GBE83690.1 Phosphatidylinositol transfer protein [Sparassis crispa]
MSEPTAATTAAESTPDVSDMSVSLNEVQDVSPDSKVTETLDNHGPAAALDSTAVEPEPIPVAAEVNSSSEPTPEQESQESQNALTQKFTAEEWAAVKALRAKLPEVLKEAFPKMDQNVPITLWGVSITANGPHDARVSVVLIKFLRARDLSVTDAQQMLVKTLRWRADFKIDDVVKEQYDEKIFGPVGRVFGKDKEERPVTYNLYGTSKEAFSDVDRFIRWRIAFMEKSINLLDFENIDQMVQVHDYEGVSLRRTPSEKAAAAQATAIFQDYYPEFLSRKFFVNIPALLTWIFWLFKPLISAATLAKFTPVGTGAQTIGAALLPYIDATELPKRYGGEASDFA